MYDFRALRIIICRKPDVKVTTLFGQLSRHQGKCWSRGSHGAGSRGRDQCHQVGESLVMDAPTLLEPKGPVTARPRAEKGSDLIKNAVEMCGCSESFEPAHGAVPLCGPAMILFQMMETVPVRSLKRRLQARQRKQR